MRALRVARADITNQAAVTLNRTRRRVPRRERLQADVGIDPARGPPGGARQLMHTDNHRYGRERRQDRVQILRDHGAESRGVQKESILGARAN